MIADLFSFEQERQLRRVSGKISATVMEFLRLHGVGGEFYASELHSFTRVIGGSQIAPGSADRILRDLRKNGFCNYDVLNRRASKYRISAIKGA